MGSALDTAVSSDVEVIRKSGNICLTGLCASQFASIFWTGSVTQVRPSNRTLQCSLVNVDRHIPVHLKCKRRCTFFLCRQRWNDRWERKTLNCFFGKKNNSLLCVTVNYQAEGGSVKGSHVFDYHSKTDIRLKWEYCSWSYFRITSSFSLSARCFLFCSFFLSSADTSCVKRPDQVGFTTR